MLFDMAVASRDNHSMAARNLLGLKFRIVLSLVFSMALFIVLTEAAVSRIARISLDKQTQNIAVNDGDNIEQVDTAQVLLRMRRMVLFYLISGAVIALALGTYAINRLIVKPLGSVMGAVERVAEGELGYSISVRGTGEMAPLCVAFNRMSTKIGQQQSELKDRLERLEESSHTLKSTQDKLIRAAKLASVGTLAAGVAHEIGNPLAGLLGLIDALKENPDEETCQKYYELMGKEIRRIDRIISELLTYARPAKGDLNAEASCNIKEVLEHTRALLSAQNIFDSIELSSELSNQPLRAIISPDDLTQVLINLFLNSAQSMKGKAMKGKGTLHFEASRIDSWYPELSVVAREGIRMIISDSGPGISKEDVNSIFDPFFSTKEAGEGTGLGLAICQSICERAFGDIKLDPNYTQGAKFVLTVPAVATPAVAIRAVTSDSDGTA